jgi:hypothetical protein
MSLGLTQLTDELLSSASYEKISILGDIDENLDS